MNIINIIKCAGFAFLIISNNSLNAEIKWQDRTQIEAEHTLANITGEIIDCCFYPAAGYSSELSRLINSLDKSLIKLQYLKKSFKNEVDLENFVELEGKITDLIKALEAKKTMIEDIPACKKQTKIKSQISKTIAIGSGLFLGGVLIYHFFLKNK